MNLDIKQEIKNIVLKTKKLKNTFIKKHKNTKYSLDLIIEELVYFLKSGVSYRMLRSKINYKTLHYYHSLFAKNKIFLRLFNRIKNVYLKKYINKQDNCSLYVDSTIVNNKYGINKIGRNKFYKNKRSTKISLLTDINGFPLSILFMKGNYHDNKVFEKHIRDAVLLIPNKQLKVIADKAYSSYKNYSLLASQNINHIIPPRRNMKLASIYKYDKNEYKNRIKIEHIFGRLKINRKLLFRYEKYLRNFSSFIFLAFSFIAINIIKSK